jgi:hypothetical protein
VKRVLSALLFFAGRQIITPVITLPPQPADFKPCAVHARGLFLLTGAAFVTWLEFIVGALAVWLLANLLAGALPGSTEGAEAR